MSDRTVPQAAFGDRQPGDRRRVLLTGASGVVGQALLPRLAGMDVTALVHRTPVRAAGVTSVAGDLTRPRLGLSAHDARLARDVDAVVHCAAVTDFARADGSLEATNIAGTEQVLDFAATAGVPLYHVSTAYVDAEAQGERGRTAVRYAASKKVAEGLVRDSGIPHAILRPSIVVGDSRTGATASFQGLHGVAGAILAGMVPIIPFDPTWPLDIVPADMVAEGIAVAVENDLRGEIWLTSGDRAIRLETAVETCVALGAELGLEVAAPRFVPPEMFERLVGPVFLEALPEKMARTVTRLLEFFSVYLAHGTALPSSLPELAAFGAKPLPDQRETLLASLRYWADATGVARKAA